MGWQPEDLTPQIDGASSTFSTTFQRVLTQVILFHNGEQVPGDQFSEPSSTTIQTGFTPVPGDKLFVYYETDQTLDGRVVGYPEDPTNPPVEIPEGLEELLEDVDNRLDVLEAEPAGADELPPLSGVNGHVLTEVQPGGSLAFLPPAGAGPGGAEFDRVAIVPTLGQTVFNLPNNIGDVDAVFFFVNMVQYVKGIDFLVSGVNQLTWTDNEFPLDGNDLVEIVYLEA